MEKLMKMAREDFYYYTKKQELCRLEDNKKTWRGDTSAYYDGKIETLRWVLVLGGYTDKELFVIQQEALAEAREGREYGKF